MQSLAKPCTGLRLGVQRKGHSAGGRGLGCAPAHRCRSAKLACRAEAQDPLLVRVARGEDAERTPVWLMRQAGRYMAEFRAYSDKYPFRHRSETPEIAIELSMQPYRAFKPDGVIMFSDILTPLPALGIEFDVIKGKGPQIADPVRTAEQVAALRAMDDPAASLPFVAETLKALRSEVSDAAVLGFIGTPWTLAAYAMEGRADRHLVKTKQIMMNNPQLLHSFLDKLTDALAVYVCYQIESGAQCVQLFDSWAHHLSPAQFAEFSMPYAERIVQYVKARHPQVPLIFHANGGSGKLHVMKEKCTADVVGLDWSLDMGECRAYMGEDRVLQGNVDPMILFGDEDTIKSAVKQTIEAAGSRRHILNVGHGVIQGTPEESVGYFCEAARNSCLVSA
eukprot:scaffold3691_cov394-Prasinococcus_capsulatus_cf.AAC.6